MGRNYRDKAGGLRAGSVSIEPKMRPLLSGDGINPNNLTMPNRFLCLKVNEEAAPKTWERLRCLEAILDSGGLTESGLDEFYGALPNHENCCVAAPGPGNARHDRRIDD